MLDTGYSSDAPFHCKIDLLLLPILEEYYTPQAIHDSVEAGKLTQDKPGTESKSCGKQQELKVCLEEGKVEGDGLSELVSYLVDIAVVKEIFGAPLLDPIPVECVVVKRKYRDDILPLAVLRSNASAPFSLRLGNEEIDEPQPLGLHDWFLFKVRGEVFTGSRSSNAIQPILDPVSIGLLLEQILGSDFDKYQEGRVGAPAHFGGQTDTGKGFDQLDEGCFGFSCICCGCNFPLTTYSHPTEMMGCEPSGGIW